VLDQLSSTLATRGGSFHNRAWNLQGDGGTFRDGEPLVASFCSNRDCCVKVLHVDALGETQLIFPNQLFPSNDIAAGRVYRTPDASCRFTLGLKAPYGTELITVVAPAVQFTDIEEAFADMAKVSRGAVTRRLVVARKGPPVADAGFSHAVLR
jgi:hypothetical protein